MTKQTIITRNMAYATQLELQMIHFPSNKVAINDDKENSIDFDFETRIIILNQVLSYVRTLTIPDDCVIQTDDNITSAAKIIFEHWKINNMLPEGPPMFYWYVPLPKDESCSKTALFSFMGQVDNLGIWMNFLNITVRYHLDLYVKGYLISNYIQSSYVSFFAPLSDSVVTVDLNEILEGYYNCVLMDSSYQIPSTEQDNINYASNQKSKTDAQQTFVQEKLVSKPRKGKLKRRTPNH